MLGQAVGRFLFGGVQVSRRSIRKRWTSELSLSLLTSVEYRQGQPLREGRDPSRGEPMQERDVIDVEVRDDPPIDAWSKASLVNHPLAR